LAQTNRAQFLKHGTAVCILVIRFIAISHASPRLKPRGNSIVAAIIAPSAKSVTIERGHVPVPLPLPLPLPLLDPESSVEAAKAHPVDIPPLLDSQ